MEKSTCKCLLKWIDTALFSLYESTHISVLIGMNPYTFPLSVLPFFLKKIISSVLLMSTFQMRERFPVFLHCQIL